MKIKSCFARTVEDAMAMARQGLGPEAMLVNSRRAPPEARSRGEYEVVFADLEEDGQERAATAGGAQPPSQQPSGDRLSTEVAELKRELEGMRRTLTRSAFAPTQWLASSPDMGEAAFVLWHGAAHTGGPGDRQPKPGIGAGAHRASVARPFGGIEGPEAHGGSCTPTWRLIR